MVRKPRIKGIFLKIIFGLIISVVLSYILLSRIDFSEFLSLFRRANFGLILLAFAAYFLSYIFRSLRFNFILKSGVPLKKMFSIVAIHNFFIQTLPFRLGEVAYLYMIKKEKVKFGKNLSSLAKARMLDLTVISIVFLFFTLIFPKGISQFPWKTTLILFALLFFVMVVGFFILRKPLIRIIKKIKTKRKFLKNILTKVSDTLKHLVFKSKKEFIILSLFSLAVMICFYTLYSFLFSALGISLSFVSIILGVTIFYLVTAIPINGVLHVGTFEVFWTIVFTFFGITEKSAIVSGFFAHTIFLLFVFIITLLSLLFIIKKRRRKHKSIS